MLAQIILFLNEQMTDFGTVAVVAVSFWLAYFILGGQKRGSGLGYGGEPDVARRYGLPPTRSGGR